jgi:hypothetical protein
VLRAPCGAVGLGELVPGCDKCGCVGGANRDIVGAINHDHGIFIRAVSVDVGANLVNVCACMGWASDQVFLSEGFNRRLNFRSLVPAGSIALPMFRG